MKQIRKFEQEAIVNQIMEGVNERLDSKIDKAKKSKEYKAIAKMHDSVAKLQNAIDRMVKTKNEEVQILNEQIKKFNDFYTVENVGVSTIGSLSLKLVFKTIGTSVLLLKLSIKL